MTGDIRYYGLLKTFGVTPRQLKRIIRQQALLLCAIGCPVGLAAGWLVGYLLVPLVIERTSLGEISASVSSSPLIFFVSAFFTVVTVLLSCKKPGRMAAKVSPVEAVKYTEAAFSSKRKRKREHAGVGRMALANLGRNKKKTVLVVVSLSLSVVLLAVIFLFTGGFSMERYLENKTCAILLWEVPIISASAPTDRSPGYLRKKSRRYKAIPEPAGADRPGRFRETIRRSG